MRIVMMALAATAVLVWPSGIPAFPDASGRVGDEGPGSERSAGSAGGAGGAGGAGDAGSGGSVGSSRPNLDARSVGAIRAIGALVPVAEVAGVMDLLALTLRAGIGLVEAMEAVAGRVGGPLGLHLQTVAAAGRWGVEDAGAWASVPSAWQPAARALRMAATAGVPPADALVSAAQEVRRGEQHRLEVATATLGIRIVLPLGLVFLPAFILTTVVPIVLALAQQLLADQ